jgi:hypothetical protein
MAYNIETANDYENEFLNKSIKFDKDGIEIISDEEYIKRIFHYGLTYVYNNLFNNYVQVLDPRYTWTAINVKHMKFILGKYKIALNGINYTIKLIINDQEILNTRNIQDFIDYFQENASQYNGNTVYKQIVFRFIKQ